MEQLLLDILARLRADKTLAIGPEELDGIIRRHNRGLPAGRHLAKKRILPYYLWVREREPDRWASWDIDPDLERRLVECVRMKPRRTASGVATITVITRPAPCGGDCVFCPCDLRMPKSYLHDEPACQRAEHNFFDPYLQVHTRLRALTQMGHPTDKVELIVLGGTWTDYPRPYQLWFVRELFRALNEWPDGGEVAALDGTARTRYDLYREVGLSNAPEDCAAFVAGEQAHVDAGEETYNEAFARLYGTSPAHAKVASWQHATQAELEAEQNRNERAAHRVVGLVVETRPDTITPESLTLARALGCTKIQVGVQSTRQEVLDANGRGSTVGQMRRAFSLIRLFGFKIHSHLMLNLIGSTPADDEADFATFVSDPGFEPDEVKLYPCALVGGTRLVARYEAGGWRPYTAEELVRVLVRDVLACPPYVRVSRMIRDIGADDILAGNKQTNLRQMVEEEITRQGVAGRVREMRFREIARSEVRLADLRLDDYAYGTSVTREHFLQWVTPEGRIAGFLRLSLPRWDELMAGSCDVFADELPVLPGEAMIREVHVYGAVAHLGKADASAQHQGLGRTLVERACEVAREAGYRRLNVISSVGTREYYRGLGFVDAGLYQAPEL